ncbi:DoxX family protein [Streptomyces bluensis]|uniref:DoxX family protein n=1 Tax=Streptomyces bluensis TaxID=33897 RepID=A0ABW6UNN3_9ACTN
MNVALTVLAPALGLLFLSTGGVKVLGIRQSLEVRDQLGLVPALWPVIGGLELAGGSGLMLGLLAPPLGLTSSIGLLALMIGALATRLRARAPFPTLLVDAAVLVSVASTAALYVAHVAA